MRKKCGYIGHPYTIPTTPYIKTPLKQDDPLSLRKLTGEGQLSEHKTCLGWDINTRYMRLFLTEEKKTAWTNDIKEALASTKIKIDTLESLIGKLNHAAHVIPPARYFLNWLRHLLKKGKNGDHNSYNYGINYISKYG